MGKVVNLIGAARVVEIVGPAGVGKSALAVELSKMPGRIRTGLSVWRLPRADLAATALRSAPRLARWRAAFPKAPLTELKHLIRLETLRRRIDGDRRASVIDEGPIFAVAQIRYSRGTFPDWMSDPEFSPIPAWAPMFGLIVCLDAPDRLLVERIRERAKEHRMKERPAPEIEKFVTDYREALRETIGRFGREGAFRMIAFDTSLEPASQIAEALAARLQPSED